MLFLHRGYFGSAAIEEETGILHGRVLVPRDVITYRGTTIAEARAAFEASVDDYLAFCQERGEAPEGPSGGGPGGEG